MFLNQVESQPEIQVVKDQYIEKGVAFTALFEKKVAQATEGIRDPDVRYTARLVAGWLINELTETLGKRWATKPPTTWGGRLRFKIANIFWPQPKL